MKIPLSGKGGVAAPSKKWSRSFERRSHPSFAKEGTFELSEPFGNSPLPRELHAAIATPLMALLRRSRRVDRQKCRAALNFARAGRLRTLPETAAAGASLPVQEV